MWLDKDMEATTALPTSVTVNFAPVFKRNGHTTKAIAALKQSGWTFDGATKTWTGSDDLFGKIDHYIGRGVLVAAD